MTHRWMVVLLLLVASTALAASDSPEGAPAVTIPIIGDTAGARAFYYSAIFVENHLDREQRIRLDFYPANGTRDRGGFPRYVTVPPRSITVQETDAVHNLLGLVPTNAIGAERLVAVTSTGAEDPEGRITARATITALPRDGSGTYRQEVGQVRDAELRGTGEELVFVGARGGPHARTNVGVVNFDRANPAIYAVTISK